jgi:hypothetical protein
MDASMIFGRQPVAASTRRVLMTIAVVVVPDRADVSRVRLEQ